jgi:hypothetical protein
MKLRNFLSFATTHVHGSGRYSMTLANGGGVDGTRARDRRSRLNPRTIDLSTLGTVVVHPDLE